MRQKLGVNTTGVCLLRSTLGLFGLLLASSFFSACNGPSWGEKSDAGEFDYSASNRPALSKITRAQWRYLVTDLVGQGPPSVGLPPDTNPGLFRSIGARSSAISSDHLPAWRDSAGTARDWICADADLRLATFGCDPTAGEASCVESSVRRLGQHLFRRTLSDEEVQQYTDYMNQWAGSWLGPCNLLESMLISPHFLFRTEVAQPVERNPGYLAYDGATMAERIAFLLWASAPDEELLEAAQSGQLDTSDGIAFQVERMLEDPKAMRGVKTFFTDWLALDALSGVRSLEGIVPGATSTLATSMRLEVFALAKKYALDPSESFLDLFTTRETFVNAELATLYNMPDPASYPSQGSEMAPGMFTEPGRQGLLGTAAIAAATSVGARVSISRRGSYVLSRFLCTGVGVPSGEVADFSLPEDPAGEGPKTTRDILQAHTANPACAVCHIDMDGAGLGLEKLGAIGQWRAEENGLPLTGAGQIQGATYHGVGELGAVLKSGGQLSRCITQHVFKHGTGQDSGDLDQKELDSLHQAFVASGYSFSQLLVAVATSPSFRGHHSGQDGEE